MAVAVPERPLLKPWYRLAVEDGRVVLEYAQSAVVFDGAAAASLLPVLLPLLDGEHALGEIVAALGEPAEPAIQQALQLLARHRLLTSSVPLGADPDCDETLRSLVATQRGSRDPVEVARALREARVAVAGGAPVGEELARVLRRSGVGGLDRAELADSLSPGHAVVVVAPASTELAQLEAWNRRCLREGVTWLALPPCDGRVSPIGPLFVPGETACFDCFRIRRASVCGYAEEFWSLEASQAEQPSPLPLSRAVAGIAGWLVLRWLTGRDAALPGVLHTLDVGPPVALTTHHLWRVPRCPSCSDVEGVGPPSPWFDGALR